uniref:GPI-anchored wall transfer protein n=1 Tax=Kwoniella dejecticola CBS 10117 TaxID=1296121 RepID=A0A1A5ZZB8_9TREE|nr:uncharacterized protein I303_06711 [Kwoniella dejecticola CBS 10117]OBR83152.1 hypothetical protein I303_06711 [Kwoniella dejecticola CBS 10117]
MADYKSAKEAFVSDNPGSSVFTIIAISLTAWTSYTLYATLYSRFRPSFLFDYLTSALPLLLSITLFATSPITYNASLVTLSVLVYLTSPTSRRQRSNGNRKDQSRSKGSWLEESDSDEEIAEPPSANTSTNNTPIKLPSQVIQSQNQNQNQHLSSATSLSYSPSPSLESPLRLSVEDPFSPSTSEGNKVSKRRLSPQPSPDSIADNGHERKSSSSPRPDRIYVQDQAHSQAQSKRRLPFLSVYRAHMMIMTVHCILAVDFKVFPRWLGKCEDFGTSLMDVGVGSFVFSLGLISIKSLSLTNSGPRDHNKNIFRAIKKAAPTLMLGFVRLLMVKGIEYPEHMTEYGVHWNFFFTIGLLPIFGVLVRPLRKWVRWSVLGIGMSLFHQLILSKFGLQTFLLSPSRPGLLGLNKEGIASLPGYISIYLLGLSTGEHIQRLSEPVPPKSVNVNVNVTETIEEHLTRHYDKRGTELVLELFSYTLSWWAALGAWTFFGLGEVSRRFANTSYVLFIASYNTLFLLGYLTLESIFPHVPTPPLLESINKNGLVVFLVANLFTGLVNVSMESMYAGKTLSMVVLVGYSLAVCAVARLLRNKRISL